MPPHIFNARLSVHDARLSVLDYKSFFAPLFFKKAVEVKGEQPLSPSADGDQRAVGSSTPPTASLTGDFC
jgi:hypothetical protein